MRASKPALKAAAGFLQRFLDWGVSFRPSRRAMAAFKVLRDHRKRHLEGAAGLPWEAVLLQRFRHHDLELLDQFLERVGSGREARHLVAECEPKARLRVPFGADQLDIPSHELSPLRERPTKSSLPRLSRRGPWS